MRRNPLAAGFPKVIPKPEPPGCQRWERGSSLGPEASRGRPGWNRLRRETGLLMPLSGGDLAACAEASSSDKRGLIGGAYIIWLCPTSPT